jgi:hypothetical protein
MTDSSKQEAELRYFTRFAQIVRLAVEHGSVSQRPPPEPDITCIVDGIERSFELTVLADEGIERQFGSGNLKYTNFKMEIADVVACVTKKSTKMYSRPLVELVIHDGIAPIDDLWLCDEIARDALLQKAANESPFVKIWLVNLSSSEFFVYVKARVVEGGGG